MCNIERTEAMKTVHWLAGITRFRRHIRGSTAIEYALIASGIAGAIIAVTFATGTSVLTLWTTVKNAFG
jgi:Flp pilus assembly pilin Flp